MPKSPATTMMDEVQWQLRPLFKAHGFRMRSRTCNRSTADGIIHVINFQLSRDDSHKFTVNVGVYVPEIASVRLGKVRSDFVQEVDCCIRRRLGQLANCSDIWWDLPASHGGVADVRLRIERDAMPFLTGLDDRDSVLRRLESEVDVSGGPPRISRAIILANRGEIEQARELLQEQARGAAAGHVRRVQEIADLLSLGRIKS